MLRFLPGILLVQALTVALVLLAPADLATNWGWLRLAVPVLIVGVLTAFWFGSMAEHQRKDLLNKLQANHAKERETIRVKAEQEKAKVAKEAHKETLEEIRRTSTQANIKVGVAIAGAAGLGGLLLLTQFITLGIMALTTAGGALGGYVLRLRQEKGKPLFPRWGDGNTNSPRMINATPAKKALPNDH